MTGSIGAGGTLPSFDAKPIEQRVKAEYQQVVDSSGLQARYDDVDAKYQVLHAKHEAAEDKATSWRDTKAVGIPVLIGAGLLGIGGAIVGRNSGAAGMAAAAGMGAAIGGGVGMFVGGISWWVDDFVTSSGGTQQNGVELEPSPELKRLATERYELDQALEALPDPERIKPGEAWMNIPRDAGFHYDMQKVHVEAWVGEIMNAHDHDNDGELRIDDTSNTARNELLRSPGTGPFTGADPTPEEIQRVRELPIDRQRAFDSNKDGSVSRDEIVAKLATPRSTEDLFGLQDDQLARYDTDSSGTVSRPELAEGLVRDSATEAHASYHITFEDGTVPTIVHGNDRDYRSYG